MSAGEKETTPVTNRRSIAFRWVLPIAEILVCAALLWPWRGFLAWQLRASGHAYWPAKIHEPVHLNVHLTTTAKTPQETNAEELSDLRLSAPAVLNFPCSLLGLLRREAVPRGMLSEFWRSLSWPFFGIVFWWIAGRGIEALLASRRRLLTPAITWIEVFVASLEVAIGAVIWAMFSSGPNDRSGFVFPWTSALAATGMWILLGVSTIVARVVQWRIRSRSVTGAAAISG
jgi:hypothetical protein